MELIEKQIKTSQFFVVYLILGSIFLGFLLLNDDPISLSIVFLSNLLLFFPVGFLFVSIIGKYQKITFYSKIVLSLSVGGTLFCLWSFFISPFFVNSYSLLILFFVTCIINIVINFEKNQFLNIQKYYVLFYFKEIKKKENFHNILLISIFLFLIIFTLDQLEESGWAPYGDSERHSFYTSIQTLNEKIKYKIPHTENKLSYPLGIHFFVGSISHLFNLLGPQAILVMSALGIFLISISISGIVWKATSSSWLTLISTISIFFIYHSTDLTKWIWGYFFNGVTPNLWGFFVLICFILVILHCKDRLNLFSISLISLLMISNFLIYTTTIFYSSLVIIALLISYGLENRFHKELLCKINKKKEFLAILPFIFVIIAGISTGEIITHYESLFDSNQTETKALSSIYGQNLGKFLDDIQLISIFVLISFSVYQIVFKKEKFMAIFSIMFVIIQINDSFLGDFGFLASTARYNALISIFSWIMISIVLSGIINNLKGNIKKYIKIKKISILSAFLFLTIFLLMSNYELLDRFYGDKESSWWYSIIIDYIPALYWIEGNIESDELILNYHGLGSVSHPYNWISTLDYKQVVNNRGGLDYTEISLLDKLEINLSMNNYSDMGNLFKTLNEYDIKYVILESIPARNNILEKYPYLQEEFKDKKNTIYSVSKEFSLSDHINKKINEANNIKLENPVDALDIYSEIIKMDNFNYQAWKNKLIILDNLNDYSNLELNLDSLKTKINRVSNDETKSLPSELIKLVSEWDDIFNNKKNQLIIEFEEKRIRALSIENINPDEANKLYFEILKFDQNKIDVWEKYLNLQKKYHNDEKILEMYKESLMIIESNYKSIKTPDKEQIYLNILMNFVSIVEKLDETNLMINIYYKILDVDRFNNTILLKQALLFEQIEKFDLAIYNYELLLKFDQTNQEIVTKIKQLKDTS